MHSCLIDGEQATPIVLLKQSQYSNWLTHQPPFTQNQLKHNGYDGKGHALVLGETGELSYVVYCIADITDYFVAGELPNLLPAGNYALELDDLDKTDLNPETLQQRFAESWGLAAYRYDRYKSDERPPANLSLSDVKLRDRARATVKAISLTRDLVNAPASDMMPEHLSEASRQLAAEYGAEFNEIVGDDLLSQNYPMIHAVGRASVHAPRLIDLHWGDPKHPKITLVGKGVCFDSGGLNLKPGNYMRLMKKDMGGAAHVLGLAELIMANKLPVRLRVLVPAVENAVSGNAFRPGDVLPTRKGLTVEIDNTDAEGRLVLCDALAEADTEQPDVLIDFATLTGACRVALGTELPGMFCNNDDLAHGIFSGGSRSGDPVWQLPLHKPYQDMLKSDIADTVNSAASPYAGAITAALYLQLFVSDTTPWLHFDVMAWNLRKLPGRPVGGEAFGIRAVFAYLQERFENAG
ncbi:MAG: leucyl aminopeptidase family protein [Oleiphilaceae bacterium]|nr:leucyl aminopeptidase family protein [Oleiphilaceae bacterium]